MTQGNMQGGQPPPVAPRARLALVSSLAFAFPVSIAIGAYGGHYLDGKLDTSPWLTLLGLVFGVAAGFINLLKAVRVFDKSD